MGVLDDQNGKPDVKYRFDIDGLRGVAVLVVIFYHLDFALFSGGFVGVDVFFVISGFLITGIIYAELPTDRFTIAGFYARRVRRIIPVLFFIVSATALASLVFLPQAELGELSKSIISIGLFGSNVFFWLHTGYFSVAAELRRWCTAALPSTSCVGASGFLNASQRMIRK